VDRPEGVRHQALEVAPADGDRAALVERLLGLGATHVGTTGDGVVVLADPDGSTFRVLPG
jgi:adenosylcobinamide amidohydrolase